MSEGRDPSWFEDAASTLGRDAAEVAAWDRFLAGFREHLVARQRLGLALHEATGALRNFADAWAVSEERITAEEAREVAGHPDLAELNVRMDAFYPGDAT